MYLGKVYLSNVFMQGVEQLLGKGYFFFFIPVISSSVDGLLISKSCSDCST